MSQLVNPSLFTGVLVSLMVGCASQRSATTQTPAPPAQEVQPGIVPGQQWTLQGVLSLETSGSDVEAIIAGRSALFGQGNYHVVGPMKKEITALAPGRISVKGAVMRKELANDPSGKRKLRLEIEVTGYSR